jgi:hypothetical protein
MSDAPEHTHLQTKNRLGGATLALLTISPDPDNRLP